MTRRERLMATLRGEPVDRPAVNLYEIGGCLVDPNDPDPFNVYNDPSWLPLLQLAEERTDIIRLMLPRVTPACGDCRDEYIKTEESFEDESRYIRTRVELGCRTLTQLVRRDRDTDTSWVLEHLLKDSDDLRAYLEMPDEVHSCQVDIRNLVEADREIGERGIVMVDMGDPLCMAASLLSMGDYTVLALTERELFHSLLDKLSQHLYAVVERVAREFPGHLWRVYGPEYATEPYLPPCLFEEYVVRYTGPIVDMIQRHGGFARIHCHGRIRNIMPYVVAMGPAAIDPIEPPPQGDMELADIRTEYGKDLVLFGNLEISDIENTEPADFEKVVARSLEDGTLGEGRGFVLMPSAAPCGRNISARTMTNYETIVRLAAD